MEIELVDLKRQFEPLRGEIMTAMEDVLSGMHLYLGHNMEQLEAEFAAYCGAREAVSVGSGTDALFLALKARGIGPGDEVITVAHTFIATVNAILMTGATPVLVDIDADTWLIDPAAVAAAITPRTAALVPVHLYGRPAEMDALKALAAKHNLFLLEDACQAHGARYRGERTGTLGDAAAFSFYYSKNLGAYGEGGIVTTNDHELAARLRLLRNHGSAQRYHHEIAGTNSRLDELQAAVLRIKLRHLDTWNAARRRIAERYVERLGNVEALRLPASSPEVEHVYHLYVVRTPARDRLQQALRERGIATGVHYPVPVHLQPAYAGLGLGRGALPVTEAVASQILSLPIFPELRDDEIDRISEAVRDALSHQFVESSR